MKISVKGFLTLRELMGGRAVAELEVEEMTLSELLNKLAIIYGKPFSDTIYSSDEGKLNRHIRILVNGQHYSHLPCKLNTRLDEGDEICLFPPVAGG